MKLKSQWFVDACVKNILKECDGLETVGEVVTVFYPDSKRGSDKHSRMVLCHTAKNVSLFLVNENGERISLHETIHLSL